jgi:twitching motility protein PilU
MDRIINFFPEDRRPQLFMDLSLNLKAFIAQQLIPRADGKGRRVCVEILLGTPLAHDLIRKGELHKLKDLMKQSRQQGMITFDQALFELYKTSEITYDDALHYADSANEVRLMIKLDKGDIDQYAAAMEGIELVEEDDVMRRR